MMRPTPYGQPQPAAQNPYAATGQQPLGQQPRSLLDLFGQQQLPPNDPRRRQMQMGQYGLRMMGGQAPIANMGLMQPMGGNIGGLY
jgi:hypothetical protein